MIAPHRVAQIQVARVSRRTDHRATDRASRGAQSRVTRSGTDGRATGSTQKRAAGGAGTGVLTATRDQPGGGKSSNNKCRAHARLHVRIPLGS